MVVPRRKHPGLTPFFFSLPSNETLTKTSFSPPFSPKFFILPKIPPNKHTLRVCLVEWILGRIEKKMRENEDEKLFKWCLVGKGEGKKMVGLRCFLPRPIKKFFSQNGKKMKHPVGRKCPCARFVYAEMHLVFSFSFFFFWSCPIVSSFLVHLHKQIFLLKKVLVFCFI